MIDRRGMGFESKMDIDPIILDRFKYDQDSDDEIPTYYIDPYDTLHMRMRARHAPSQLVPAHQIARQVAARPSDSSGQSTANGIPAGQQPQRHPPLPPQVAAT
jgi:enhancer of polycomb-like protein